MFTYILRRLLQTIPVLFGVSVIVFLLIKLVPGDITGALLGNEATPEEVALLREALGLNAPLYLQFLRWLGGALQGDLGQSIELRRPVTEMVASRLQNTLILSGAALVLSTVVGVTIGVLAAIRPRSLIDRASTLIALFGNSMPAFWIGILLILFFSLHLRWLPAAGMQSIRGDGGAFDLLRHMILPSITLASLSIATVARMTRSSMLDVIEQDFVRTAKAKGLQERVVVLRHVLRNAMLPIVTILGLQLGYMLGGAVLTETVFSWPGVGLMMHRAISTRDLPLIQGGILMIATGFVLINLIIDVLYAYLDPRTSRQ